MDKASFNIPTENGKWGTYISKFPPDSGQVPANALTNGSRNIVTSLTSMADKRLGGALWNSGSPLSGSAADQYEGIFNTGQRLLIENDAGTLKVSPGNGVFTTIGTGYTNPANFEFVTYQGRVYGCNGVDAPISMDVATAYGGVTYTFPLVHIKAMGAQSPVGAPTANAPSSGGSIPAGPHTYKVTFVYYSGVEESNGGLASNVQTTGSPNFTISLTGIPVGGYGVTARNIYRDNNDGNYLLLTTINDNTTTTFTDTLLIGPTPTPIPTLNFPPPVFKYCLIHLDRIFIIDITGKNIYYSLAGAPGVFYPQNAISGPPDDIMTGFGYLNQTPYVFGQHTVGKILGNTDGSFYYDSLSTKVGCVDNRSIQERSIVSVPTLMWLSALPNKGIYYTNGSVVEYMSDDIEDLTFNLAQINYLKRLNTQSAATDFAGDIVSTGIDLTTNPGTIQTINPTALYNSSPGFLSGNLVNIAVNGNQLQVPTQFGPALANGGLQGSAILNGGFVSLPSSNLFTGESRAEISRTSVNACSVADRSRSDSILTRISVPRIGQITSLTYPFNYFNFTIGNSTWNVVLYSDSSGFPGTLISSTPFTLPSTGTINADATVNVSITGTLSPGVFYWIGVESPNIGAISTSQVGIGVVRYASLNSSIWSGFELSYSRSRNFGSGALTPFSLLSDTATSNNYSVAGAFTFSETIVPLSGSWISPVYDSLCTTQNGGMQITLTGVYVSPSTGSLNVQGSNDGGAWTVTDTFINPTGTINLTGGGYRFWFISYSVSTPNNDSVPIMGPPTLTFSTTGIWYSPPILCTGDITALNALTLSVVTPTGTSAVATIGTSNSPGLGTFAPYVPVGSATPNIYARIQVTLTTNAANIFSPVLSSVELDWTVVSSILSSIIDAGIVPTGWGLFQYAQLGTSGAIASSFATAATAPGLASATFIPVANGAFPTNATFEFCQWKLALTATANNIPQIDSVTVNWLLSSGNIVRAASLFFNKSYYLAVANIGSAFNNLLIEYDYQGNWRIHSGANIGTMGTYFNDIYYGDAVNGNVYNGFQSNTDNGMPIVFDLRTKCFDVGDNLKMKSVRSIKVKGVNTGTLIHVYFSVDYGKTWLECINSSNSLGYQTTGDLSQFIEYFIPSYAGFVPTSGRNVIFRVVSSDIYPCSIFQITPTLYVHKGKAIREAMAA